MQLRHASVVAVLALGTGVSAAESQEDADRAALLDQVTTLERPGLPGVVSVFGDDAFAVVTGGRGHPEAVVAAARAGAGRVVAFGHNGFVSPDHLAKPGAARLLANALRWSAGATRSPTIGVLPGDAKVAAWLDAAGFEVQRGGALDRAAVWIIEQTDAVDAAGAARLEAFVRAGGGLIAAQCPWGWEQIHASRGLRLRTGCPLNALLARCGLAFADGIPDATASGAFAADPRAAASAHAGRALRAIESGAKGAADGAYLVERALRAAPPGDTLFVPRAAAAAAKVAATDYPRPSHPVKRTDALTRLAVAWRSISWLDVPPERVEAAPASDEFPGTVAGSVDRLERTLDLDATEPGWHSTGLYLLPGETLTVSQRAATGAKSAAPRWRVRIGCHSDELWDKDEWKRWPEITHTVALAAGDTRVATPWGGLVWFEPMEGARRLAVTVKGAVAAPLFDLRDADRAKTWASCRSAPGPWAELAGEHLILSLPSSAVRDLADPEPLLRWWDSVLVSHCELGGIPVPARPERFVCDAQISAGYMHSGYPIMMHLDVAMPASGRPAPLADLERLRREGTWGPFHELGHNRQRGWWTFEGTGEVTNNLFALYTGEKLCRIPPWQNPWLEAQKADAGQYLKAPSFAKWKQSPGIALTTYTFVQREFGWAPFRKVFADMEALAPAARPAADGAKIDAYVLRLSAACGKDLRPYFRRWDWPLSAAALADAEISKLPVWEPDLADVKPSRR